MIHLTVEVFLSVDGSIVLSGRVLEFQSDPLAISEGSGSNETYDCFTAVFQGDALASTQLECWWGHGGVGASGRSESLTESDFIGRVESELSWSSDDV